VGAEVALPAAVAHGTYHAYINYRCRCEPCRQTYAAYRARRIARDPEKLTSYMRTYSGSTERRSARNAPPSILHE
jgi:hypothetical protein